MAANECLIEKQNERFLLINRAVENIRNLGEENITRAQIQTRITLLDSNWKKFESTHERLSNTRLTDAIREYPYFTNNVYAQCEEKYADTRATMLVMLEQRNATQPPPGAALADQFNGLRRAQAHSLPKISLPKFAGDYQSWRPFQDLFTSMVGNNVELSCVEKFHYLKTSLTGEAAQLIANLQVSNENFARAWDTLVARYENKRILVDAHLDTIFKLKPIQRKSASELKNLLAKIKESLGALSALGAPVMHWDYIIVYHIVRRLDPESHEAWEFHRGASTDPASFNQLDAFLEGRIRALEVVNIRNTSGSFAKPGHGQRHTSEIKTHTSAVEQPSTYKPTSYHVCSLCNADHYISACPSYQGKTPKERKEILVQYNLCYNCLGPHRLASCRSIKRCHQCNAQHHTSIHGGTAPHLSTKPMIQSQSTLADSINKDKKMPCELPHRNTDNSATATSNHVMPHPISKSIQVLLATALIRLRSPRGYEIAARALLDQGSEISFISKTLVQQLHLERRSASIPLIGIGAHRSGTTKGVVTLTLRPHFESQFECKVTAFVLPKLTAKLPSIASHQCEWPHLSGLTLADPNFTTPGKIDIILGADIYGYLLEADIIKGTSNAPIAQRTSIGWIISGMFSNQSESYQEIQPIHGLQCSIDYDLQELLQRFWVQEESQPANQPTLSQEEEDCEAHFLATHSRDSSGRYVVRLPFKSSPDNLGDSRASASRMLSRMMKRFSSDSALHSLYTKFLREYEDLGHMRRVPDNVSETERTFYLPHHGVTSESSTTTKLRVVFNGSCQTTNGRTLNEVLHVGAKLQTDLSDVILWWRQFQFVFSADIEKMFRQIRVHPEDWDYQRILWSHDLEQSFKAYQLMTVTYGLGPAPFLAIRVLQQLVKDEGHRFPLALDVIRHGTYVDDFFGGADNIHDAQEVVRNLDSLCMAGGFKLQKWAANDQEILSNISTNRHAKTSARMLNGHPLFKALGIAWQPNSDAFVFSTSSKKDDSKFTKRTVLSRIAQLFDPLGWLAPVTIRAKILMQDLWLAKIDWDEKLPENLSHLWLQFLDQLEDISLISIPRWLGTSSKMLAVEIHGFSDASQYAMAAVLYIRVIYGLDNVQTTLLRAKTKVAPLKRMTIPRLELSAAAILTREAAHVRDILGLAHAPIHLWTDSSVTLTWIKGHPSRWKDYVHNRVTNIQETLPQAHWHHVPGKENPADCASRGLTPQQLKEDNLWWNGPQWLTHHSTLWPTSSPALDPNVDLEEKAKIVTTTRTQDYPNLWNLVERYSSLTRLLRITATCRRLFSRNPRSPMHQPLKPLELESERLFWVKTTQQAYFSIELATLSQGRSLANSNALLKLIPFIGSQGLLRVGGRLRNSLLNPETKHPLILPKNSALTRLVIADAHEKSLHGGTQVTLAYIRCTRHRGITAQQLMGQLPTIRTTPSKPFLKSGIDYADPLTMKTWLWRAAQNYNPNVIYKRSRYKIYLQLDQIFRPLLQVTRRAECYGKIINCI